MLHLPSLTTAPLNFSMTIASNISQRTYSYHRFDLASNCRLEYEDRNLRKEKKELAAYEALTKSKKNDRTE